MRVASAARHVADVAGDGSSDVDDTNKGTDMTTRSVRVTLTMGLLLGLLLLGCQTREDDGAIEDAAHGEEAEETQEAEPDEPEAAEFRFVYTGEGEDGCSFEGQDNVGRGQHVFELVNEHDEDHAYVNVQRLAEGYTYDDFLASIGDDRPVRPPDEDRSPARHDWLDGDWRTIAGSGPGSEDAKDVTLVPGDYLIFCWGETPDPTELSKLWPISALEVTE